MSETPLLPVSDRLTDTVPSGIVRIIDAGQTPHLERHPLSEAWGNLPESVLPDFDAEVSAVGILTPIDLYQGKVLDGWHRYQSSLRVGVDCTAVDFAGTPDEAAEHVIRRNLHRRHLSAIEAAIAAVKCFDIGTPGGDRRSQTFHAKQRLTIEELAQKIGVGTATISRARRMLAEQSGDAPPPKRRKKRKEKPDAEAPEDHAAGDGSETAAPAPVQQADDPAAGALPEGAPAEGAADESDASVAEGSDDTVEELRERIALLEGALKAEQDACREMAEAHDREKAGRASPPRKRWRSPRSGRRRFSKRNLKRSQDRADENRRSSEGEDQDPPRGAHHASTGTGGRSTTDLERAEKRIADLEHEVRALGEEYIHDPKISGLGK